MDEDSREDRVRKVLEEQLGWSPETAWHGQAPHFFSLEKTNIHENKASFLYERDLVTAVVNHLDSAISLLVSNDESNSVEQDATRDRLEHAIDAVAIQRIGKEPPKSVAEMVLQNVLQSGFYLTSMRILLETFIAYQERATELAKQEVQYWNLSHRPPNYYARTIALRLAQFYARTKGRAPTFGTSSDGPHPSTEYGRALEKIFEILEIKVKLANPAKWAVSQITDDDIVPPQNALQRYVYDLHRAEQPAEGVISLLAKQLATGRKKGAEN
mgnify:CR=1 FL=1